MQQTVTTLPSRAQNFRLKFCRLMFSRSTLIKHCSCCKSGVNLPVRFVSKFCKLVVCAQTQRVQLEQTVSASTSLETFCEVLWQRCCGATAIKCNASVSWKKMADGTGRLRLQSKVAIITGGSKGIGEGIVRCFGKELLYLAAYFVYIPSHMSECHDAVHFTALSMRIF